MRLNEAKTLGTFSAIFTRETTFVILCLLSCKPNTSERGLSLRKHAYSNILKIFRTNYENFQIKSSDIFNNFIDKSVLVSVNMTDTKTPLPMKLLNARFLYK